MTLFQEAMKQVRPLKKSNKAVLMPKKRSFKRQPDWIEPAEFFLTDSDSSCILTHQSLFFAREGLQQSVIRKLKRGEFPIKACLDLHGLTVDQARSATQAFLYTAHQAGHRCVLMIHGKGSVAKTTHPRLKNKLNHWLPQMPFVLAFCSALPAEGGVGAAYVLLKSPIKSNFQS